MAKTERKNKQKSIGDNVKAETAKEHMQLALSLSLQLKAMAENNEWEDFEHTLRERDSALESLRNNKTAASLPPADQAELAKLFEEIRNLQQQITTLAETAHAETKNLLKDSQKSNKAVKSYQANR